MRTGIIVNNYDPSYKQRVQVRLYGVHDEKIDGQYVILDDDLPWASPAPNMGGNSGTFSVPEVGSRVYVDGDNYHLRYYGQVEVKSDVKKMMHDNAEQSDKLKVIAYSTDRDDKEDYMKIYYLPKDGLTIECYGHSIKLTQLEGVKITSKDGSEIDMTNDGDINITAANNINISCRKLNLTQGSLDEETVDKIVLGSRMQDVFNHHIHFSASPGGVTTTEPIQKIKETDFSKNIRISNSD